MPLSQIILAVVQLLIQLTGSHEEAHRAISEDAQRRANAAADAVAAARILAGQ